MPATTPNAPLTFGILGCANIAKQFVRDVAASPSVRVEAVASRDAAKAAEFAKTFSLPRHLGSYEALLTDPAIDAIYIPLPNSLHAEWAIKAAQAGKHILCEKPLALSRAEAQSMFDAARLNGVLLIESYPYAFQPQFGEMVSLLRSGAIGDIQSIQACFGFTLLTPAGNIRMQPEMGGGALLDAGSYPVSLVRKVMGEAPIKVIAESVRTETGVDISTVATLFFTHGRTAQISCGMNVANHRRATLVGTQGTIEAEYLNHTADIPGDNPFGYLPSQLRIRRGIAQNVPFEDIHAASGSGFLFAAESFARMVRERDVPAFEAAAEASIDIAAILEAIARSAANGEAVPLHPAD